MSNLKEKLDELYPQLSWDTETKTLMFDGEFIGNNPKNSPKLLEITTNLRVELDMTNVTDYNISQMIIKMFREEALKVENLEKQKKKEELAAKKQKEKADEKEYKRLSREDYFRNKPEWFQKLKFDDKNRIKATQENVMIFLENSEYFKDKFTFDTFSDKIMFDRKPYISSKLFSTITGAVENTLQFNSKYLIELGINRVALNHSVNYVRSYMDSLRWDGQPRLENYFIDVVKAEDTDLNRHITKNFFYGMMQRLDYVDKDCQSCIITQMPILIDQQQGTGKTEIMQFLLEPVVNAVGYNLWVKLEQDDFIKSSPKDLIHKIKGAWVVCFDECSAILKCDDAKLKSFITDVYDRARLAYEKESQDFKRRCVFIANSNDPLLLKDYSGNAGDIQRRYMMMDCCGVQNAGDDYWKKIHNEEYRKQILAEAWHFYKNNPDYNCKVLKKEYLEQMIEIQEKHKTLQENKDIIYRITDILNARIFDDDTITRDDHKKFLSRVKEYINSDDMFQSGKAINCINTTELLIIAEDYCKYKQSAQKLSHLMLCEGWSKQHTKRKGIYADYFIRPNVLQDEEGSRDLFL